MVSRALWYKGYVDKCAHVCSPWLEALDTKYTSFDRSWKLKMMISLRQHHLCGSLMDVADRCRKKMKETGTIFLFESWIFGLLILLQAWSAFDLFSHAHMNFAAVCGISNLANTIHSMCVAFCSLKTPTLQVASHHQFLGLLLFSIFIYDHILSQVSYPRNAWYVRCVVMSAVVSRVTLHLIAHPRSMPKFQNFKTIWSLSAGVSLRAYGNRFFNFF